MRTLVLASFFIAMGCGDGEDDPSGKPASLDDTGADSSEESTDLASGGVLHGGALAMLPPIAFNVAYRQAEKDRRGFNSPSNIDTCIPVLEGASDCFDYSPPEPLPATGALVQYIQKDLCQRDDFLAYVQAFIDDPREWELPGGGGGPFKSAGDPQDIFDMSEAEFMTLLNERFEGGARACAFDQVAAAPEDHVGGITYTLRLPTELDESDFCIVTDPETVSWTPSQSQYPHQASDDGDVELMVGPSSEYTGVLGERIGSFPGLTEGVRISNAKTVGDTEAITTEGMSSVTDYTVIVRPVDVPFLTTSGMPFDDEALSVATVVLTDRCSRIDTNELLLFGESLNRDGSVRECTRQLEVASAYSSSTLTAFCCANPEMCGPVDTSSDICADAFGDAPGDDGDAPPFSSNADRNDWCFQTGLCCDFGDAWTPYSSSSIDLEWQTHQPLKPSLRLFK